METEDEEELRLVRASASLLSDLESSLPKLLWKPNISSSPRVHRLARARDLDYVIQLIEPFQGEPQLLDSKLKVLLPPLVDAYLAYLQLPPKAIKDDHVLLDVAVSKILYTFCKVRGEKIIAGFLNNEPRHLESILLTLEERSSIQDTQGTNWEASFILLTWLSHLLLAPFDLASISVGSAKDQVTLDLELPLDTPDIARRIIYVALRYVPSVTREQEAAAKLLVRLVKRPDMQKLHLPNSIVSWALRQVDRSLADSSIAVNACIGPLRYLAGMAMTPDSQQTLDLIPSIHMASRKVLNLDTSTTVHSSAVIKRLAIKITRSVAVLSLRPATGHLGSYFEANSPLEEGIDSLLQCLADRDTKVRFAASKAISVIVMSLDPELGHEVIQAVLDSFKEDMTFNELAMSRDFTLVDPLKWHGLTLTLAHNLFRRSASPDQLPDIVNTLLLALTFEQRASTGNSIGTNVRDAACFGFWSLARRYTTAELSSVDTSLLETSRLQNSNMSIIQVVAIELILSACLDPGGNIRRGCSAALQELIGRHPDQVSQGIPLVQVVDYQAVGLRQRAMVDVVQGAAALDPAYWQALLYGLLDWRGISAPDALSREVAATSLGRLSTGKPYQDIARIIDAVRNRIDSPLQSPVEDRHGALLALARIMDSRLVESTTNHRESFVLFASWQTFGKDLHCVADFTPRALKAEFPTGVATFITSLARLSENLDADSMPSPDECQAVSATVSSMATRAEEPILKAIPSLVNSLLSLQSRLSADTQVVDVRSMHKELKTDSLKVTMHGAGKAIALGAAFAWAADNNPSAVQIVQTLCALVSVQEIEWRVLGLQAVQLLLPHLAKHSGSRETCLDYIVEALYKGLNDYTVTERGDVGSLVRIQAIKCVGEIWTLDLLSEDAAVDQSLHAEIVRLSLEKLDRVRLLSARCLSAKGVANEGAQGLNESDSLMDVSSYMYFRDTLAPMRQSQCPSWTLEALIRGCASSAGTGNEALLQSARAALTDVMLCSKTAAITNVMSTLYNVLKDLVSSAADTQPTLELLAYVLDSVPWKMLVDDNFSWRNLLSQVQKAHFKSSIIPKILAAVDVYRRLAEIPQVRPDVMKKLFGMLKTNPYARVRVAVAETLWCLAGVEELKPVDWSKAPREHGNLVSILEPLVIAT